MMIKTMEDYSLNMERKREVIRALKKRNTELEGVLRDITNEAKEVLTSARNTPAVRRQLEMSGSIKHYIVPRRSIISAENYLKEQGEWVK
jgi:hypothetical protein